MLPVRSSGSVRLDPVNISEVVMLAVMAYMLVSGMARVFQQSDAISEMVQQALLWCDVLVCVYGGRALSDAAVCLSVPA